MKSLKEILEPITSFIKLSPIANTYYRKTRQWMYHKINEDTVNNVKYELSDKEIDTLIDAFYEIRSNLSSVIDDLKTFKQDREYLKTPIEERKVIEKYKSQINERLFKNRDKEIKEIIINGYTNTQMPHLIQYLDSIVKLRSWEMYNLKNAPIKYDGDTIRSTINKVMWDIADKLEASKKRKKKEVDSENVIYDYSFDLKWNGYVSEISYKIYYQSNNLTPPDYIQEKINEIPTKISVLGETPLVEVEEKVYEKLGEKFCP